MSRPRLRRQLWIFLLTLACIALGAWLTGLVGNGAAAYVAVAGAIVATLVHWILNRHTTARRWLIAACVGSVVAAGSAAFLEPSLVLAIDGREVTAVVTHVDVHPGSHGRDDISYSLRQLDGTPIAGQLTAPYDVTYRVGQHVTVIEAPAGNADPSLPGELDIPAYGIATGAGLLLFALSLVMIGRAGVGEDPFWPFFLQLYGIRTKEWRARNR